MTSTNKIVLPKKTILAAIFTALFAPSVYSAADATNDESNKTNEDDESVTLTVTGTMIRGVDVVGSQLIEISKEDIESTGMQTTADVFATVPQLNSFGTTPRPGTDGANPTNPPALRGLPASATLNLVNGHRLPGLGSNATLTDPSSIPVAAIERVEILADGASATYGSDAVAGVINVILRDDYDGADIQASYGSANGYKETNISAAFGKTWDTGSFLIAGQTFANDPLYGRSRDYVTSDLSSVGGLDGRSSYADTPNVEVDGQEFNYNGSSFSPGYQKYDALLNTAFIPQSDRDSVIATFNQDVGERIVLFGDAMWGKVETAVDIESPAATLTITDVNPYFMTPVPGATEATVLYKFVNEYGPGRNQNDVEYSGYTLGADIEISDDWQGKIFASVSKGEGAVIQGATLHYNAVAMATALLSTDPATAFDPFGGQTSQATIDAINTGNLNTPTAEQELTQIVAHANGPIMELPAGDLRFAGGLEYREETYDAIIYQGTVAAPAQSSMNGKRDITSAFSEIYIPIFSEKNAVSGINELTLSASLRYDEYSDFGSTTNPKVSMDWGIVETLKFKASYSESFRAPSLADATDQTADSRAQYLVLPIVPSLTPNEPGPHPGDTWQMLLLAGGKNDLNPETAENYSFGLEYTPTPELFLELNYWDIAYEGAIGDIWPNGFLNKKLEELTVTWDPTVAQVDAAVEMMPQVWGVPIDHADIDYIADWRRINLGSRAVSGIDLNVKYLMPETSLGTFYFGLNSTYFTDSQIQTAPGSEFTDMLENGATDFHARGYVSWSKDAWAGNLFINYVSDFTNNAMTPAETVDSWVTMDASISYDLGEMLSFERAQIQLDVRNLLDEEPPRVNSVPGFSLAHASLMGRLARVTVRFSF